MVNIAGGKKSNAAVYKLAHKLICAGMLVSVVRASVILHANELEDEEERDERKNDVKSARSDFSPKHVHIIAHIEQVREKDTRRRAVGNVQQCTEVKLFSLNSSERGRFNLLHEQTCN